MNQEQWLEDLHAACARGRDVVTQELHKPAPTPTALCH